MKTWVYSDPHFGHGNICKFTNYDGTPLRPWDDVDKMTTEMIQWYNEIVHPDDRVYILGDVAMTPRAFRDALSRLQGRIVLVPSNHEPKRFDKIASNLGIELRGYVVKKGFIMSHIPIHPGSLLRWKLNIHGHTHANAVGVQPMGSFAQDFAEDTRYYSACVERTNFRPIELQQILDERKSLFS